MTVLQNLWEQKFNPHRHHLLQQVFQLDYFPWFVKSHVGGSLDTCSAAKTYCTDQVNQNTGLFSKVYTLEWVVFGLAVFYVEVKFHLFTPTLVAIAASPRNFLSPTRRFIRAHAYIQSDSHQFRNACNLKIKLHIVLI